MHVILRWSAALVCLAGTSATALGQSDYPSRPIRFLVGVVPGGAADILARAVGQKLTERLKQQVVVDNRAGASQTIAAELTARAPPDGHTMLMVPSGHAINPAIIKLRYDSLRDFSTIGLVAGVPNVLVTRLNRELTGMLQEPAFRELLTRQGADPLPSSPEEFAQILAVDNVKWDKVVKAAGVKVE